MGAIAPTAPFSTKSLKEKDRLNLSHKSNQYVTTSIKTIINTFKENRERLRDFVVCKKLRYYSAGRAHPSFSWKFGAYRRRWSYWTAQVSATLVQQQAESCRFPRQFSLDWAEFSSGQWTARAREGKGRQVHSGKKEWNLAWQVESIYKIDSF